MTKAASKFLTRPEELILLTVLRLKDNAYCIPIFDELQKLSPKKWTLGSIYGPLYRLEQKGLLHSFLGDPSSERGGKSKRFYRLTSRGIQALQEIRRLETASWQGLTDIIPD
jgi:DNA-binding PadR family transcriptional regulator